MGEAADALDPGHRIPLTLELDLVTGLDLFGDGIGRLEHEDFGPDVRPLDRRKMAFRHLASKTGKCHSRDAAPDLLALG